MLTINLVGTELVIEFTLVIIQYLVTEVGQSVGVGASYMLVEACSEAMLREGGLDWGHPLQLLTFTFRVSTVLER